MAEQLEREGWEHVSDFADGLEIYKRGDERLLYDRKNQRVRLRYTTEEEVIDTEVDVNR